MSATLAVVLLPACSGSDGIDAGQPDVGGVSTPPGDDADVFTEIDGGTAADDEGGPVEPVVESVEPVPESVEPVVESLPAVAETGVPGIDSVDEFCRSWSIYAGSVQALSLAWALQPAADAARLEAAAATEITQAVVRMSAVFPDEIESNRVALTVDVAGPFLRRADRALALLVDAGLGEDQIDTLGASWIDAITEQGLATDSLTIEVPTDSVDALDVASQAFAAELPSVLEDPTLDTTEFDIGPSLAYISANCPDQGTLAGNDEVDAGGA